MKLLIFHSIRSRLAFWFLFLALVPLLIGIIIAYQQESGSIEKETSNRLATIRDMKVIQLENWVEEREGDLMVMSGDYEIRDLEGIFEKELKSEDDLDVIRIARVLLIRNQRNYVHYEEIFIVDVNTGIVELSSDRSNEGINKSQDIYITEPLKTGELYIKDIYLSDSLGTLQMTFSIPIFSLQNREQILGVLVARINLENTLFPLLLGRTWISVK